MMLSLDLLPPGKMTVDIMGGGIEGGRNLLGFAQAVDYTGGGLVVCKYTITELSNRHVASLRYLSRLGAKLNGGAESIDVPLLVDFITPVPGSGIPTTMFAPGGTFSDGTTFGDETEYVQSLVSGDLAEDADLNAGTIALRVINGRELVGGEWFSIYHTERGHRAYRVVDVDDSEADGENTIYTVAIRPTLREATVAGTECRFVRPRCQMRLAPGTTIPFDVEGWWRARAEVSFIEAA